MGYLDTLLEMESNVKASDFPVNHKINLIDLIEKERALTEALQDTFVYFYTDILGAADMFDFSSVLNIHYAQAQGHANTCISLFIKFTYLEEDPKLQSWLQSAIRFVDCIVIHYLQEVLNEAPEPQEDRGIERSRYKQITRQGVKAQRAGRIMDDLYGERNKMEHSSRVDPKDSNKRILIPPNFNRVKRKIKKRFPEALESFNEAFKEYYL